MNNEDSADDAIVLLFCSVDGWVASPRGAT
jgi:hypothetical protein